MKATRAELKAKARKALKGNFGILAGGVLLYHGVSYVLSMAMQLVVMLASGSAAAFSMLVSNGTRTWDMNINMAEEPVGIILIISAAIIIYIVIIVITYLLMPGLIKMNMNVCDGRRANVSDLFWAFRNRPWKFIGIGLLFLLGVLIVMIPIVVLAVASAISGETGFVGVFMVIYAVLLMVVMIYLYMTFAMFYYILVEDPEKGIIQALGESRCLMKGNRWRYFMLGFSWIGWECLLIFSFGIGYLWLLPYMYCTTVYFYYDLKPPVETISPEVDWEAADMPSQNPPYAGD